MNLTRMFLWGLAALTLLTVAGLIASFSAPAIFMGFDPGFLFIIALLCMAYCVIGVLCSTAMERGHSLMIMCSGIWVGGIVLALCIGMITLAYQGSLSWSDHVDQWMRILIWLFLWPCVVAIAALLLIPRSRVRWWPALRSTAIVLTALLAIAIAATVTFYPAYPDYSSGRYEDHWETRRQYAQLTTTIISLLSIGAGATIAISMLIAALPTTMFAAGAVTADNERKQYVLTCPRCGNRHQALTGVHHCTQCGLRVVVNFP